MKDGYLLITPESQCVHGGEDVNQQPIVEIASDDGKLLKLQV
ncbi:hypothetical protein [Nostoc sp.]